MGAGKSNIAGTVPDADEGVVVYDHIIRSRAGSGCATVTAYKDATICMRSTFGHRDYVAINLTTVEGSGGSIPHRNLCCAGACCRVSWKALASISHKIVTDDKYSKREFVPES